MKYLVSYTETGEQKCFYTNWFDKDNHFNAELNMVVFNLLSHKYTSNGIDWMDIDEDHL